MDITPPRHQLMLDCGKKKALLNWINSLGLAECIDSLHQLCDGKHLSLILSKIDPDVHSEDVESVPERMKLIEQYLECQYKTPMSGKIDFQRIQLSGEDFELAKVTLLMLCSGLISTDNELFVESAVKLDTTDQVEIRDMASAILTPNNDLEAIEGEWYKVLTRPFDPCGFTASSLPQTPTTFSTSMMQASADSSVLSRFASPSRYTPAGSPVIRLVRSPNVANRIIIQRKEQKIRQLQRELVSERNRTSEFEIEVKILKEETIKEKEEMINKLENKLRTLRRQTMDLQATADHVVGVQQEKNELAETLVIKQTMLQELKGFKESAMILEKENHELYDQVNFLKSQLSKAETSRSELLKVKGYATQLEGTVSEIKMGMATKSEENIILKEECENLQRDLMNLKESHSQELAELQRRCDQDGNVSSGGERMDGIIEKQLREHIEDLEDEMSSLKAQLVSRMQKHKQEKQNIETKFIQSQGDLQRQVHDLRQSLEVQGQRSAALHNQIIAKSEEIEDAKLNLEEENHQLQESIEHHQMRSRDMNSAMQELNQRINTLAEQNDKLRSNAEMAQEEFNSQVEAMMKQRDELQAELADRDNALDQHIETSHEKDTVLHTTVAERDSLADEMKAMVQSSNDLQDQVDALQEERDDLELKVHELDAQMAHLQEGHDLVDSERTEWQQKAMELEEALSENGQNSNQKISTFENQLSRVRERNKHLETMVEGFEAKVGMLENGFKSEIEKATQTSVELKKAKEELKLDLTKSQARAEKMASAFESARKKMAEMEQLVSSYYNSVMKLEEEMKKSHLESQATKQELETKVMDREKNLRELESMATHLKKERKTLVAQYEEEKSRAVKLEEALIQVENQVQDVEDELRTTKCNMTNIQESLNTTQAMVSTRDNQHHEELNAALYRENQLQTDLDQAQAFIDEIKSELGGLQKNLPDELNAAMDKNKSLRKRLEEQRKENSDVVKTLQGVEGEKATLQQYLESSQNDIAKMWTEIEANKNQNTELKQTLEHSQADNKNLWNELSEYKGKCEEMSRSIPSTESDLRAAQGLHGEAQARIVVLSEYLQTAQERCVQLEDKLAMSRDEVALLENKLQSECSRAVKFEDDVNVVKLSKSQVEEQLRSELKEAYAKEQELEEALDSAQEHIDQVEEELMGSKSKLCTLTSELQASKDKEEDQTRKIGVLETQLQEAVSQSNCVESQLRSTHTDLAETLGSAQARVKQLEKELTDGKAQLSQISTEFQVTREREECQSEKMRQLESQLEEFVSRSDSVEGQLRSSQTSLEGALNTAQARVSQLETQVEQSQSQVSNLTSQLKVTKEKGDGKTERISLLEDQLRESLCRSNNVEDQLQTTHTELRKELSNLNKQISSLKNKLSDSEAVLEKQKNIYELNEQELEFNLLAAQSDSENKTKEMEEMAVEHESTAKELTKKLECVQAELKLKTDQLADTQKQCEEISGRAQSQSKARKDIEIEINKLQFSQSSNVDLMKSQLAAAKGQQADHEKEIKSYKQKLAAANNAVVSAQSLNSNYKHQIEQNEEQLRKIDAEKETYQQKVKSLGEKLDSSKRSDESFRGVTEQLQNALSQLQVRLHSSEEAYKQLQNTSQAERKELEEKFKVVVIEKKELEQMSESKSFSQQQQSKHEQMRKKVEELTTRAAHMQQENQKKLEEIEKECRAQLGKEMQRLQKQCEQLSASNKRNKDRLEGKEQEYTHLKELTESYKQEVKSKREMLESQTAEVNHLRLTIAELEAKTKEMMKQRDITQPLTLENLETVDKPVSHRPLLSPTNSISSILSGGSHFRHVPRGLGDIYQTDDEPEHLPEFGALAELQRRKSELLSHRGASSVIDSDHPEYGRLSELQRRNTLCLPHMKSSYPVETQSRPPKACTDTKLKFASSPIAEDEEVNHVTTNGGKRSADDVFVSVNDKRLRSGSSEEGESEDGRPLTRSRKRDSVSAGLTPLRDTLDQEEKRHQGEPGVKMSTPGVKMYRHYSPRTRAQMKAAGLLHSGQKPSLGEDSLTPGLTGFPDLTIDSPMLSNKPPKQTPASTASRNKFFGSAFKSNSLKRNPSKENISFSIGFSPLKTARRLGRSLMPKNSRKGSSSKSKPLADKNVENHKKK